jgi:hypothetical protein
MESEMQHIQKQPALQSWLAVPPSVMKKKNIQEQ